MVSNHMWLAYANVPLGSAWEFIKEWNRMIIKVSFGMSELNEMEIN